MIGRIAGTLIEKNPPHLLVDCHGVGYEIDVPMSTFYNLPATGEGRAAHPADRARGCAPAVRLRHHRRARDLPSAHQDLRHRRAHRAGGAVGHVGGRTGAGRDAAGSRTADAHSRHRQKTAERLLLELKGKLGADLGAVPGGPAVSDDAVDVLNALLALGYSDKEAAQAIKQVPAGTGVSEGIKLALKALSKG